MTRGSSGSPHSAGTDAARTALERADQKSTGCAAILAERAEQHAAALRQTWDAQLVQADHAARTLAAGPGRLGIHRGRVRNAQQDLNAWADRWAAVFIDTYLDMHTVRQRPSVFRSDVERIADGLHRHSRRLAADHAYEASRLYAAQLAREQYLAAAASYHQTRHNLQQRSHLPVYGTG